MLKFVNYILYVEENAFLAGLMKVIVGRCLGKKRVEQVARQDRKKKRTVDGRQEGGRDARGWERVSSWPY